MADAERRKRSFVFGYLQAVAGTPLLLVAKREPIAYLCNGVRLPVFPKEWNRKTHPYAFITYQSTSSVNMAYLYCSSVPIYKSDEPSLFAYVIAKEGGSVICHTCSTLPDGSVNENWSRYEDGDVDVTANTKFTVSNTASIKWANYDMLNYSDDSAYLAASDPVPVYK